jgi:TrmH family RNA methyltransferase
MTSSRIDSPHNTHVAAARSLLTRKGRTAASAFLVEGPHAVDEALAAPGHRVRELFVTDSAADREKDLLQAAARNGVRVRMVTERVLGSIRDTVTPQGVVAVVETPTVALADVFDASPRLVVLLEEISDPGNAGTVIRTADAAGADAVVATTGSVDVWAGKCVRASAGSVFHTPLVTDVTIAEVLDRARAGGAQVLATAADGMADLDDLIDDGALASPTVWVFGNEAHGVSDQLRAAADRTVRLPVYGAAESLNLAAAAAVCLYASARAHRR